MEVDYHRYEGSKSTCHEWTSRDKVENYKEDIIVEKEELIRKKEMENKEILREEEKNTKISSPQYESELWKAIEVNNKLQLDFDEQQDDTKY